jgi:two-component system, response regulator
MFKLTGCNVSAAVGQSSSKEMNGESIDILLVEDNPDDALFFKRALELDDALKETRLEIARDGAEALAILYGGTGNLCRKPKLIVLDLNLPNLASLDLVKCLKADARTRAVPIVVLTSSRSERDLAACDELGINSYLLKPVNIDQFRETVRLLATYWLRLNQKL